MRRLSVWLVVLFSSGSVSGSARAFARSLARQLSACGANLARRRRFGGTDWKRNQVRANTHTQAELPLALCAYALS